MNSPWQGQTMAAQRLQVQAWNTFLTDAIFEWEQWPAILLLYSSNMEFKERRAWILLLAVMGQVEKMQLHGLHGDHGACRRL